MKYFTGLDISLSTTFVSIIDDNNNIIKEGIVKTNAQEIFEFLEIKKFPGQKIGIESGQLSISMCKSLSGLGLDVICVDARHMAAALSARINKNDKNDARGIANHYRPIVTTRTVRADDTPLHNFCNQSLQRVDLLGFVQKHLHSKPVEFRRENDQFLVLS